MQNYKSLLLYTINFFVFIKLHRTINQENVYKRTRRTVFQGEEINPHQFHLMLVSNLLNLKECLDPSIVQRSALSKNRTIHTNCRYAGSNHLKLLDLAIPLDR